MDGNEVFDCGDKRYRGHGRRGFCLARWNGLCRWRFSRTLPAECGIRCIPIDRENDVTSDQPVDYVEWCVDSRRAVSPSIVPESERSSERALVSERVHPG